VSARFDQNACRDLVLASTSAYRRTLLARLGLPFRCVSPRFDESSVSTVDKDPREAAELLARGKAESIAAIEPAATIIGCDQLVSLDRKILGKPGSIERAVLQLEALAGRTHELFTALVVLQGHQMLCHIDVSRLRIRPLARAELERYVAFDRPVDCAGSYKLEERGVVLFERIETEDHTAIIGLPLIALVSFLRQLGFSVP
jgi:7-methyl-GTP pyrophosphatase